MNIKVTSNSVQQEAADAKGVAAPKTEVEETKSASLAEDETNEDSETSDVADDSDEEVEAKDADEDSEDEESKAKDDEKPKKRNGFKKRIDKLNKRAADAEREREYWKAQALKGANADQETKPVEKKEAETTGRPIADDFETHEEWVEAVADWKAEQKLQARDVQSKADQAKTEYQRQVAAHQDRVKSFKEKTQDYDEIIGEALEELGQDFRFSVTVEQLIVDSDNGPELMYELAKDPEELARINAMPAVAAARAIGKFEERIAKASTTETKEVKKTKAPSPIAPVGTKSSGGVRKSIYDPNLSQREYEQLRREQIAKRA